MNFPYKILLILCFLLLNGCATKPIASNLKSGQDRIVIQSLPVKFEANVNLKPRVMHSTQSKQKFIPQPLLFIKNNIFSIVVLILIYFFRRLLAIYGDNVISG